MISHIYACLYNMSGCVIFQILYDIPALIARYLCVLYVCVQWYLRLYDIPAHSALIVWYLCMFVCIILGYRMISQVLYDIPSCMISHSALIVWYLCILYVCVQWYLRLYDIPAHSALIVWYLCMFVCIILGYRMISQVLYDIPSCMISHSALIVWYLCMCVCIISQGVWYLCIFVCIILGYSMISHSALIVWYPKCCMISQLCCMISQPTQLLLYDIYVRTIPFRHSPAPRCRHITLLAGKTFPSH